MIPGGALAAEFIGRFEAAEQKKADVIRRRGGAWSRRRSYATCASRPASTFLPNSMRPLPGPRPWRSSAASSAIPASPQSAFAPARKTLGVTALRALAGCNVGLRAFLHV